MPRRIHVPFLAAGEIELPPAQARHLRDVLRLRPGEAVEAFDDAGRTAPATVAAVTAETVTIRIERINAATAVDFMLTIAAAVPKGQRADWMVEKLAELGVAAFIPLMTERSVTHPAGKEKLARWTRLATEASRQSGRAGVMRIEPLTPVARLIKPGDAVWLLSPEPAALPIKRVLADGPAAALTIMVGPEGGWTEAETESFAAEGATPVRLAGTILRVETAAVAAAAIVAAWEGEK